MCCVSMCTHPFCTSEATYILEVIDSNSVANIWCRDLTISY